MAQVKLTIPDSQLDAEARKKIRALEKQIAKKDAVITQLRRDISELMATAQSAKRIQQALKDFTSIIAEELNLEYDPYRGYYG